VLENGDLTNIGACLFEDTHAINLFSAIYQGKTEFYYGNNAQGFIDYLVNNTPDFKRFNLLYAYELADNLSESFLDAINLDKAWEESQLDLLDDISESEDTPSTELNQPIDADCQPTLNDGITAISNSQEIDEVEEGTFALPSDIQESIDDSIEFVNCTFGVEDSHQSIPVQDELMEAIEDALSESMMGLLAGKSLEPIAVAKEIPEILASIKHLSKTLRNVSAISDSLMRGLEEIKSGYADYGYSFGRDLSKIDASEYCNLATPETKKLFLLKYAKGELLEESTIDKKGLGDLFIGVDTSGSTDDRNNNGITVLDIELGIALSIALIASKNRCSASVIPFHDYVYSPLKFTKSKDKINEYFALLYAKNLEYGGTSFNEAFSYICDRFDDFRCQSKRKPGIVFLTDGYDSLNKSVENRIIALKKRLGVKVYIYFVCCDDPRNHTKHLLRVSDNNFWIDSRKDIKDQLENFEQFT
jgi:hypothetical protein